MSDGRDPYGPGSFYEGLRRLKQSRLPVYVPGQDELGFEFACTTMYTDEDFAETLEQIAEVMQRYAKIVRED